jgi:hypothetical protein
MSKDMASILQSTALYAPDILVQCEVCGKVGSYHDILTLTYPDGKTRTAHVKCVNGE